MGLDTLLLLMLESFDLSGVGPFYQFVLQAWKIFTIQRRFLSRNMAV